MIITLNIIAIWILGVKMGMKGWEIFVPFYNLYKLFEKVLGNGWLFLVLLIPSGFWVLAAFFPRAFGAFLAINIILWIALAVFMIYFCLQWYHMFGYKGWFVVGWIFLPFVFNIVVAFGDHTFQGQIPDDSDYVYRAVQIIKQKIRNTDVIKTEAPIVKGTCPNCGFVNHEAAAFCEKCGTKLN